VEISGAEKIDDSWGGVVSQVKEHIHFRKLTIQKILEIPAHAVNVCVGKDTNSHAPVPVFAKSSSKYSRMKKKDKP
jgi:hypothetical protein